MRQKENVVHSEVKFEAPSWNQIYDMLLDLADRIRKDRFKPDVIVGVSRGGWPPARILSDLLSNPNLANVRAEFYLGVAETKCEPALTQPVSVAVEAKRVLIVDEIADTGKSLKLVKEHIIKQGAAEARIATVYFKPWSVVRPDYYSKETSDWIVFPWEVKETIRKIMTKCTERGKPVEQEAAKLSEAGIPNLLVKRFLKEISEEEKC
jgi:hypoxanthine phosphoribosyltransferase